ncbi:MAG: hypothetical protein AAF667_05275 [Pseudomonadota bacterium]
MSEIDRLSERLKTALDRIEAAAMTLPESTEPPATGPTDADIALLKGQLEDERTTNAQLIERVKALKDRQENQVAQLEQSLRISKTAEAERNQLHQKMRGTIEQLRDQVARLTEANRAMVGDAHLVNTSMMVELEALRAARLADAAEVDDLITELEPLIEEAHGA